MTVYTFAFFNAPEPQIPLPGIDGNVEYVLVDRLVAAIEPELDVQELKEVSEEVLLKAVLRHDRVICELFQHRALLPLRFGTAFVSRTALEDYLHAHGQELGDRLQRLQGYAEYPIKGKFLTPSNTTSNATSAATELKGREYLLAKRDFYVQQQEMRSQQQQEYIDLVNLLQAVAKDLGLPAPPRIHESQDNKDDLRAYILLKPNRREHLQTIIHAWQAKHASWQIAIADPLPPYHFADM
jgi:hypothetical protein